ncbi:MAG: RNA-binding cell elongation regulator Jag/EloR [Desulfomonilaceae bacterium]|nr:RNA-binding cell elongation regulator Jag/EloR [Desulfomonilaceae bacterium]
MSSYEFTGKTIKEAVAKACEELRTEEALLDVEVLEESTRGFLGIVGQRDARVRVRKRNILKEVLEAEDTRSSVDTDVEESPPEESLEEAEVPRQSAVSSVDEGEVPENREVGPPPPALGEAKTVLEEILRRMPVEAEVRASMSGDAVYLDIKGDGSGLLIGKKGQTLDALQFLVNKIINKTTPSGSKTEIIVDTENYRMRKTENLREMALKMSEKAKRTLKPVSFNPMPAGERRIVHLILADEREVYTKSYGEGPLRRIIVYPRHGMAGKRRRR